jgi:hypothetical protein
MAEAKKPTAPIADVAHPGKTAPSPNSKSVIVRHHAGVMADPMVVTTDEPAKEAETAPVHKPATGGSTKAKIVPLATPAEKETPGPAETPAPDVPAETPPAAASAVPTPQAPMETAEAEVAAQAEHEALVDKLSESKQYYLPINSIEKRRTKRVVILGAVLSIVLMVAWADVALDSGIIQLGGVKPVTHFFSN